MPDFWGVAKIELHAHGYPIMHNPPDRTDAGFS